MGGITDLAEINIEIHDEWFDLDRLDHDTERSEVRVTIYRGRKAGRFFTFWREPAEDGTATVVGELIIRQVVRLAIEDEAEIGWYDVHRLRFDPEAHEVRLCSNVPLEIAIGVRALDVELRTPSAPA